MLLFASSALAAPPSADAPSSEVVDVQTSVLRFAGGDRVRLERRWHGLPVFGGDRVHTLDPYGHIRRISQPTINLPVRTSPTVSDVEATQIAAQWMTGSGQLWPPRAQLGVMASQGTLVWRVDISREAPLAAHAVFVDAHTGQVLQMVPTLWTNKANVYPFNPVNSALTEVQLRGLDDSGTLTGEYALTRSCTWVDRRCRDKVRQAAPDDNGDWFFPPDDTNSDDPFAEVQLYHHLDLVSRWFEDRGVDHSGPAIEGLVNFSYSNAFFGDADGDQIAEVAFGQTSSVDYAYDSDVIYHEYSHKIFRDLVNPMPVVADQYGTNGAIGGINEGSSDLFAALIGDDPVVGEYAGQRFGEDGIRDIAVDHTCPDDIRGESHEDGRIWASMGWNIAQELGTDLTAELMLGTLATLPQDATWEQGGQALQLAADDLLDAGAIDQVQHETILHSAATSGVLGCERFIALDDGEQRWQYAMAPAGSVAALNTQFTLHVPQTATSMYVAVEVEGSPDVQTRIFVRRAEPVIHRVDSANFWRSAVAERFDRSVQRDHTFADLRMLPEHTQPLVPGATYYIAVAVQFPQTAPAMHRAVVHVNGSVEVPEPAPIEEAGGCGCNADGSGSAGGWFAWFAALLWVRIVRTRRPVCSS
ncbi:MAG: Zn-dependent metalloprotease [Kiritimatiellia bacterium]|jgi:Zn-dependent metalloprotease